MNDTYTVRLSGAIVPKARPRVTRNGVYMPVSYSTWKNAAIIEIEKQLTNPLPVGSYSLNIRLIGKHSKRGDGDNIAGSIMDALVQSDRLKGDNLNNIPNLSISLEYDKGVEPYAIVELVGGG